MRFRPVAVATLLAVAACALRFGLARHATRADASEGAGEPVTIERGAAPAGARVVEFLQPERAGGAPARAAGPAVELSADDGALLAEAAALQFLARDTQLELTARQWSAFAAVTLEYQAVRLAYEASLARRAATWNAAGRQQLEIPAYPAAGDRLREKFHAALAEALGAETAGEIRGELGRALEGHFAGFGVSAQTLEFAGAAAPAAELQVTRTVHYWNSIEGAAALTLRRETHFPALEDPSGAAWGPLLARLAQQLGGSSGG